MTRDEAIAETVRALSAGAAAAVDALAEAGLLKLDVPAPANPLIDLWLKPGAIIPVSYSSIEVLVREIERLRAKHTSHQRAGGE